MSELPKLIIFDFDNVMYRHEDNAHLRVLAVADEVVQSYFNIPPDVSRQNHIRCWDSHKNGFLYLLDEEIPYRDESGQECVFINPIKPEFRKRQYLMAHHAFERILRSDVHGIIDPEVPKLVYELSKRTKVCFASHAMTPSLHMMMSRVGLSAVFLNNAFGMTCLGGDKGWARKDDVNSGVYQWICNKYGVSPTDAMMVEDTHENLIGAHAIDMQTVHIGWGKPKLERHIDWNFEKTSQFLRHTLVHGVAQPQRMVRKFG